MEQNVFAAFEPGGPQATSKPFVQTGTALGQRRGFRIEIDVVCDIEIEMAVAVVIEKGAAGVPAFQAGRGAGGDAGFFRDIGERAVAIVVIERAIAPIS